MIPDFTQDGLLPPGIFDATIRDIYKRFVSPLAFPESRGRKNIFAGYCTYNQALLPYELILEQYLDGGFIGTKKDPSDIDLLNFFDGLKYDETHSDCSPALPPAIFLHSQAFNQLAFRAHPLSVPIYPVGHPKHAVSKTNIESNIRYLSTTIDGEEKGILRFTPDSRDIKLLRKLHKIYDKYIPFHTEGQVSSVSRPRPVEIIKRDMQHAYSLLKTNLEFSREFPETPSIELMVGSAKAWLSDLTEEYKRLAFSEQDVSLILVSLDDDDILDHRIPITKIGIFFRKFQEALSSINEHLLALKGKADSIKNARLIASELSTLWLNFSLDGSIVFALTDTQTPKGFEDSGLKKTEDSVGEIYRLLHLAHDKDLLKNELVKYEPRTIRKFSNLAIEIVKNQTNLNITLPESDKVYEISPDLAAPAVDAINLMEDFSKVKTTIVVLGQLMALDLLDCSFKLIERTRNKQKRLVSKKYQGVFYYSLYDTIAALMGQEVEATIVKTQENIWSDEKDDFVLSKPTYELEGIKSSSQREIFTHDGEDQEKRNDE